MKRLYPIAFAAPVAILMWSQYRFAGYIKDDAFVSLRYARNLIHGHGLVFNPTDSPLEGYSNFLWVLLEAMGLALGFDGPLLARGLSMLAAVGAVAYTFALAYQIAWRDPMWTAFVAAAALALTSPMQVWAQGGLAGPLLALVFVAGAHHLGRFLCSRSAYHLAAVVAWCVLAFLARPEGHLLMLAAFPALAWGARPPTRGPTEEPRGVRMRRMGWALAVGLVACWAVGWGAGAGARRMIGQELAAALPVVALAVVVAVSSTLGLGFALRRLQFTDRPVAPFALAVGLPLAAYHAWRLAYFGDLLPNPYFVKAAGDLAVVGRGLHYVGDLLWLNGLGVALLLAAPGVVPARLRTVRVCMAALVLVSLAYLVRIGRDEMPYFRLFLPVLPYLLVLAVEGVGVVGGRIAARPGVVRVASALLLVGLGTSSVLVLSSAAPGLRSTWHGLTDAHQAMSRYVRVRSDPGTTILFQDMGAAPYAAPELKWIDPVGVVDRHVARAQHRVGLSPFVASVKRRTPEGRETVRRLDAELRDHFFGLDPAWIAGVTYIKPASRAEMARRYERAQHSGYPSQVLSVVMPGLHDNGYYRGLFADRRFRMRYRFVRAWQRSPGYYLVLFRRWPDAVTTAER